MCPALPPSITSGSRWNIWFDEEERAARLQALLAEALDAAPDAICLQEVVPSVAEVRGS